MTLFFSHPFPSLAAFSVFATSNLTCNGLQSSDNDFSTCSPISCSSSPSPVVALLLVLFTVSMHADYSQGDLSASDLPSIFLSACYFSLLCHPSAPIHPGYVCMGQFFKRCFHKSTLLVWELRTRGTLRTVAGGGAVGKSWHLTGGWSKPARHKLMAGLSWAWVMSGLFWVLRKSIFHY